MEVRYSGGKSGGGGGHVCQIPLGPFCHLSPLLAAPASRFFFHQEEVKEPHFRDIKRPNNTNYLEPLAAPDHLPLANLPCLLEQCNHCDKNFQKNLSKHKLVVHGASRF